MNIKLKRLTIVNFKGNAEQTIEFGDTTEIRGKNRTGKTTIMDAWTYLLFDKDSHDKNDFSIKPINSKGEITNRKDNEVEGVIEVDEKEMILKKVHKEKWQKKKGETEKKYTGNETKHFIDDAPYSATDYKKEIDNLVTEDLFKLISSSTYFNSLHWSKRREILFDLIEGVNDEEVIAILEKEDPDKYQKLKETLERGQTVEKFKKSISEKKRKLKDELDDIPPRISELKRTMPEEKDYTKVEEELNEKSREIASVNSEISNIRNSYDKLQKETNQKWSEINKLMAEINKKKQDYGSETREEYQNLKSEIKELNQIINNLRDEKKEKQNSLQRNNEKIDSLNKQMDKLREEYRKKAKETLTFEEGDFICDKCGGTGKIKEGEEPENVGTIEEQKEQAVKTFNEEKAYDLEGINYEGREMKKKREELEKENEEIKEKITSVDESIDELDKEREQKQSREGEIAQRLKNEEDVKDEDAAPEEVKKIKQLEEEINSVELPSTKQLIDRKDKLQEEYELIKDKLKEKDNRTKTQKRIKELEKQEKDYSQQLADLEKQEFIADEFVIRKVSMIERRVNKLFKEVQFKMFEIQINGAEVPTCITLVDGVPFDDANDGNKIIAGLDIVSTLQNHYNVKAPVFVDHRESITDFPYEIVDSQLITLIADENANKLKVEHKN